MKAQIQQTNAIMAQFSNSMLSLKQATEQSTKTSEKQLEEHIKTTERKGPQTSKFPTGLNVL
jgi:hypothetical protein